MTTSRLAEPEARAALAAAARGRRVTPIGHAAAKRELAWRLDRTLIVEVSADVASHAGDLAERHGLRGYDAVHLASALAAGPVAAVVTWDAALGEAALKEGLAVIPAPAASA